MATDPEQKRAFDPKRHMMRVQGNREYLPVAARLVWFRSEHPDWGIVTQPVEINMEKQYAIFQCSIFNADGKLIATATKMENVKGFPDWLEKAETGSVGRALAYCGFGTQFAPELEEGGRYSDAPLGGAGASGPPGNRFARQAAPFGGVNGGNGGGNYRPSNGGGNSGNSGEGNGGGGYNGSPRPLSPRPSAARPEPPQDEAPDDEPRRAPVPADAPRAEARPFPPRGETNAPAAPRPAVRVEYDEGNSASLPSAAGPTARPAAPAGGIQRVREPEPDVNGYDSDEDEEDPFGDEEELTPAPPVAKTAPRPAAPRPTTPDEDAPAPKPAPRGGIRPLGEDTSGEELPAPPLAANRCSVDGCLNTLTPPQLTMSQNKFGRPICLLHQKTATPTGGATEGGRRGAKSASEALL